MRSVAPCRRRARSARVSRVSPCGGGHVASEAAGGRGVDAADACSFSEVPAAAATPRPPDVSFAPPGQSAASANGDRSRLVGDVTRHPAPQSRYEHAATGRDTWPRRLVPRNAREAPRVSRVSPCGGGHVASEAAGGRGVDAADACSFSEVPAAAATPRPPDASLRHRGNPRRPPRAYASSRALAVYQSRRAFCESTGSGPGTARS